MAALSSEALLTRTKIVRSAVMSCWLSASRQAAMRSASSLTGSATTTRHVFIRDPLPKNATLNVPAHGKLHHLAFVNRLPSCPARLHTGRGRTAVWTRHVWNSDGGYDRQSEALSGRGNGSVSRGLRGEAEGLRAAAPHVDGGVSPVGTACAGARHLAP